MSVRLGAAGAALLTAAFLLRFLGVTELRVLSFGASLVAVTCCWSRRRGVARTEASTWLPLGGAALAWGLADVVDGAAHAGIVPTVAAAAASDLLGLLALVLVAAAVGGFLGPSLDGLALVRGVVDGMMTATSLFLLAWTRSISHHAAATFAGWHGVLRVLSPMADVAVVAVVLVGCSRVEAPDRRRWWILAAGCTFLSIGDSFLAVLHLVDLLGAADLGIVCRVAGLGLVAVAGCRPPRAGRPAPRTQLRPFTILVPYAPLVVAGAELLSRQWSAELDRTSVAIGAALVGLLGIRQLVTQFENLEATRHLEERVTDRTEALDRQERRFRALARHASDVLIVIDARGDVSYHSAAAERVLGFHDGGLIGTAFLDVVAPGDARQVLEALAYAPAPPAPPSKVECRLTRSDGSFVVGEVSITNLLREEGVEGMLLTVRDVSERRHLEAQLRRDALHDPLTHLGNRALFSDRLANAVDRRLRGGGWIAVLLVDLDEFKIINDSLGHSAGDQFLLAVADRLRSALRPGDTVARMGGDEFAVLLECDEEVAPETVAGRIVDRLRAPVSLEGKAIVPSASIGVAVASGVAGHSVDLLRNADLALYEAKRRGKGRYQLFEAGMERQAALRVELESDLRRAIRDEELLLHYQPLVKVPSGQLVGVEALIRWDHPTRGLIPPNDFIPIAEESDLVGELGRWVLHRACTDLAAWRQEPAGASIDVAVNIATRQLLTPWLVGQVAEAIEATGIPPECLTLEITEGALMADTAASIATLEALRGIGVHLAIDDFGTGWSSLARLRTFPADKLKIDRAFVNEISDAGDDAPLIAAITSMAHSLGLRVVAEGVERAEQLACLDRLGVDEVQGYLLSRPVPAEAIVALLAEDDRLVGGGDRTFATDDDLLEDLRSCAEADVAFVGAIDWEAERVCVTAAAGDAAGSLPDSFPLTGSPVLRSLTGETPLCADLGRTVAGHALVTHGLGWLLTVPIGDADGIVGAVCVGGHERGPAIDELALVTAARAAARWLRPDPPPKPARTRRRVSVTTSAR